MTVAMDVFMDVFMDVVTMVGMPTVSRMVVTVAGLVVVVIVGVGHDRSLAR
ncbi:hypothetical protein [Sphaerisporangium rhizosphaerae]|uniref:Uncharacterized protein n=1 Tax=Sphaerisporangium rhizosphaerae TaxID=2269375 RepID=A0ABW2PCB4_9ACTN